MKALALIAPLALAIAVAAAPLASAYAEPAKSKKQTTKQTTVRAQKPSRAAGQSKVACTVFGCTQIPSNCRPETGYNWDGMPTGFDVINCR